MVLLPLVSGVAPARAFSPGGSAVSIRVHTPGFDERPVCPAKLQIGDELFKCQCDPHRGDSPHRGKVEDSTVVIEVMWIERRRK